MVVDGKDFRIGITACAGFLSLLLLFYAPPSFAENTQPVRSVDLQNALCSVSQVQTNTPEAGIEFLSETQVLVYTVCRGTGEPVLSIHGVFRNSDNEHLRAAILNVESGKIEHRYDWPTQEDNSFITVTPHGHLLVVRDHVLDTFDLEGKSLSHLALEPVVNDLIVMAPSKTVGSITVTEMALTNKGELVMGNLVLDTETLEPLFHLASRNQPIESFFAASPRFCVGWQHLSGDERRIVMRGPEDKEWKTVWTGTPRDLFGPYFLSPSTFLISSDTSLMIFNEAGALVNEMKLKSASRIAISSDGKYLAMAVPEDSPSAAFLPATRISVFNAEFHRIATFTNFANFGFGFGLAMSPGGGELAVLSNLHVNVMKIAQ